MSASTGINYLDATWNPITGCTHSGSPGCDNCWARELHEKRHRAFLAGKKVPPQYAKSFNEVQFHADRLDQPLHWRTPRDVGVVFGGDWMHEGVTGQQINRLWVRMFNTTRHRFFTLTKRPSRLAKWSADAARGKAWPSEKMWPDHIFNGVTICNQAEADAKIPALLKVPGKHWLSLEPMRSGINLAPYLVNIRFEMHRETGERRRVTHCGHILSDTEPAVNYGATAPAYSKMLSWVVVGCESGPKRRLCKLEWILGVVEQCRAAKVPCFVKQIPVPKVRGMVFEMGYTDRYFQPREWDALNEKHGWRVSHDMAEWPVALRVREKPE